MKKSGAVNFILGVITAIAIFITIFAFAKSNTHEVSDDVRAEYTESIRLLKSTINELKEDIARYEEEIERIDLERENVKKELQLIIEDNEKVDFILANGDWDDNIKFLAEFLSKEDSHRE